MFVRYIRFRAVTKTYRRYRARVGGAGRAGSITRFSRSIVRALTQVAESRAPRSLLSLSRAATDGGAASPATVLSLHSAQTMCVSAAGALTPPYHATCACSPRARSRAVSPDPARATAALTHVRTAVVTLHVSAFTRLRCSAALLSTACLGCSAARRWRGTRSGWVACEREEGRSTVRAEGGASGAAWHGSSLSKKKAAPPRWHSPLLDEGREALQQHGDDGRVEVGADRRGLEVHLVLKAHCSLLGSSGLREKRERERKSRHD